MTPCDDFGKILSGIHNTRVQGSTHLSAGIQVAALALKHRQNKVQRQRIIAFVGSPVTENEKDLVRLAKKMKKNNVAVDFISFGQEADNNDKLEKFIEQVNSGDNSHLVTIPPGPRLLSDVLTSSPIINDDADASGAGMGGAATGGGNSELFEFGVDPSVDPELALALRLSLEDEKARQEREKASAGQSSEAGPSTQPAEGSSNGQQPKEDDNNKNSKDAMDTSG